MTSNDYWPGLRSEAKWGASIRGARDNARFSNPEIPFIMLRKNIFFVEIAVDLFYYYYKGEESKEKNRLDD